jgi:hypothetical protein
MDHPLALHGTGRPATVRERIAVGLAAVMLLSGLASGAVIGLAGGIVWARLSGPPPAPVDPSAAPEQLRGPAALDEHPAGTSRAAGTPARPRAWQ